MFKVGDKVRIVELDLRCIGMGIGSVHTITWIDNGCLVFDTFGRDEIWNPDFFELVTFEPEYYTELNCFDAKHLIGKTVEFADYDFNWKQGRLLNIRSAAFPFISNFKERDGQFQFIRTCPEEFELVKALKKSITQWDIMYKTGKSKVETYKFLGGENNFTSCFLCDAVDGKCENCIDWGKKNCQFQGTVYATWEKNPTFENTLKVLNYLKSELKMLEG